MDETETKISVMDITYNIANERLEQRKCKTRNDVELTAVEKIIQNGWPSKRKDVPDVAKPYFSIKKYLVLCRGWIMRGHKIVVNRKLRFDLLDTIHYNHIVVNTFLSR